MKKVNRIAIVGSPGAGKTTFAFELQRKTRLPIIHLDYYFLDTKHDYINDKKAWKKRALKLENKKSWIIDGNFSSTMAERFDKADVVIILDYSRWLCYYSVLKRRIQYHKTLRPEMHDDWKERLDWDFIRYVWSYQKKHRSGFYDLIKKDNSKYIILKSREQAQKFVDKL